MLDFRCKKCHKLLFKYENGSETFIEAKCFKCGYMNIVKLFHKKTLQDLKNP